MKISTVIALSTLCLTLAPLGALLAVMAAPVLIPPAAVSRFRRLQAAMVGVRRSLLRLREGLSWIFPGPQKFYYE